MNKKDLAEIKRRFHPERHSVTCIRGCYVGREGQVVAAFDHAPVGMAQEEMEKYIALFRRVLSGAQGQNLIDMDFTPEQVMHGAEHALLTRLRDSALRDEDAVAEFFRLLIGRLQSEDPYLILLMHDGWDAPNRSDAEETGDAERCDTVFHCILCCVCPVKLTKPALTYDEIRKDFFSREAGWIVCPPDVGFLFPAYEEQASNIYRALYYTRDIADSHEDFVSALFPAAPPMPAAVQKETFQALLQCTLGDECSYQVVQAVHEQVMEKMEEQKADKTAEPLRITKYDVKDVLESCGVQPQRVAAFEDRYDAAFGSQAALSAVNVVSPRQFEVRTPSVIVRVQADRSDLVETRLIDGRPYILIRADEGVEVNGVQVNLPT